MTAITDAPTSRISGGFAADDPARDNEALLQAARRGEEEAWQDLMSRYGRLLLGVSRRQGMTAAESADVAQTTWLRLLTHIEDIRSSHGLGSWLATTATRECHAQRRRLGRETPVEGDHLEISAHRLAGSRCEPQEETVDGLDSARRVAAMREAIRALPERQRRLIEVLLAEDPLSYAEIAEKLQMPIGAIGPVRQRALRHLRRTLEDQGIYGHA